MWISLIKEKQKISEEKRNVTHLSCGRKNGKIYGLSVRVENIKQEGRKRSEDKEGSGIENLTETHSLKILISTWSKEQ
jgi:hypothetical protein